MYKHNTEMPRKKSIVSRRRKDERRKERKINEERGEGGKIILHFS